MAIKKDSIMVTFSRTYEVSLDTLEKVYLNNHDITNLGEMKDHAESLARQQFKDEFENLDATEDNFACCHDDRWLNVNV